MHLRMLLVWRASCEVCWIKVLVYCFPLELINSKLKCFIQAKYFKQSKYF
jgi:hypothetical protein